MLEENVLVFPAYSVRRGVLSWVMLLFLCGDFRVDSFRENSVSILFVEIIHRKCWEEKERTNS